MDEGHHAMKLLAEVIVTAEHGTLSRHDNQPVVALDLNNPVHAAAIAMAGENSTFQPRGLFYEHPGRSHGFVASVQTPKPLEFSL